MSRRSATTTKIFVGSLPPGVTADDLRALFKPYGEIAECDVVNRCGFLHMEDKDLALKGVEDLNNTNFMGGRISVEKGRSKPPRREYDRNGYEGGGRGAPRSSSYQAGSMRGGRESTRVGPYARDGGGDYERRAPAMMRNGGGYAGYDRPVEPERGYSDMYGGAPSRAPAYDDRRSAYVEEQHRAYAEEPVYDDRRYYDDRRMASSGGMDHRGSMMAERRAPAAAYDDRRPILGERRPLLDHGSEMGGGGGMRAPMPMPPSFERRPQADMYSRREGLSSKPM